MSLLSDLGTNLKNSLSTIGGESLKGTGNISAKKAWANSTDVQGTYGAGDIYINSSNVAFFKGPDGWHEVGELMEQDPSGPNKSVAAGEEHSLFLLSDGTVKSVGYNSNGQLGDGTTSWPSTPVTALISGVVGVVDESGGPLTIDQL